MEDDHVNARFNDGASSEEWTKVDKGEGRR